MENTLKYIRKSRMALGEVYFWTSTIKDWKHLLKPDKYKELIIDIWKDQVKKSQIVIYGFVIMPNHIHVLWKLTAKNGKEMPHASFNKATTHLIVKDLKMNHEKVLPYFKVEEKERSYRVWQRDPLAVLMDDKRKFEQKLDYIHENPHQERWNLAGQLEDYKWSSASLYKTGKDPFGILTHYSEHFG